MTVVIVTDSVVSCDGLFGVVTRVDGNYLTVSFDHHRVERIYNSDAFGKGYLKFADVDKQIKYEEDRLSEKERVNRRVHDHILASNLKYYTGEQERIRSSLPLNYLSEYISVDQSNFKSDKEIVEEYQIDPSYLLKRGIVIPERSNRIVLISDLREVDHVVYNDHFEKDGCYIFTGDGQNGNHRLSRNNCSIVKSTREGKEIVLLLKHSSKEYVVQGRYRYDSYFVENVCVKPEVFDIDGKVIESAKYRNILRFRLSKVDSKVM